MQKEFEAEFTVKAKVKINLEERGVSEGVVQREIKKELMASSLDFEDLNVEIQMYAKTENLERKIILFEEIKDRLEDGHIFRGIMRRTDGRYSVMPEEQELNVVTLHKLPSGEIESLDFEREDGGCTSVIWNGHSYYIGNNEFETGEYRVKVTDWNLS